MEFRALQSLALNVGEAHTAHEVFKRIVHGLAAQRDVALARVWLILPGDICDSCRMRGDCPDRARCLHLVASAGNPRSSRESWSRLDGDFRRTPLKVLKVGDIGARGEPILVSRDLAESPWVAKPDWAPREGIVSLAGQPLVVDEIHCDLRWIPNERIRDASVLGLTPKSSAAPPGPEIFRFERLRAATMLSRSRHLKSSLRRILALEDPDLEAV